MDSSRRDDTPDVRTAIERLGTISYRSIRCLLRIPARCHGDTCERGIAQSDQMGRPRVALTFLRRLVFFASIALLALAQVQNRAQRTNDVESFTYLDNLVTDRIAKDQVLRASIVVVRNGQLWYERGYGLADAKKSRPVDPENTGFYAVSISKLFVATRSCNWPNRAVWTCIATSIATSISDYVPSAAAEQLHWPIF